MRRSAPTICKILPPPPKEAESGSRLTERAWRLWSEMMNKKMYATPAIAGLLALPIAGYATYYLMKDSPFAFGPDTKIGETADKQGGPSTASAPQPTVTEAGQAARAARRRTRPTTRRAQPRRHHRPACASSQDAPKTESAARRRPSRISTPRAMWRRPSR